MSKVLSNRFKVEIRRLQIQNFLSFKQATVDFTTYSGLNIIYGKNLDNPNVVNGIGKTNILNALCFAMFGQNIGTLKNSNVPNRRLKNDIETYCMVDVFTDGKLYSIKNGINKYGGAYCNLYEHRDGELVDLAKSSKQLTHAFIESDVLKFSKQTFLKIIVLSKENFESFFQMNKQSKKQFMEDIFDLNLLGEMYTNIHKENLELSREISKYQIQLANTQASITDIISDMSKFNDKTTRQISENENLIARYKAEIATVFGSSTDMSLQQILDNEIAEYNTANTLLTDLDEEYRQFTWKINQLKREVEIHTKSNKKFDEILETVCSDCQAKIADKYDISKNTETIKTSNDKIEQYTKALSGHAESRATLQKIVDGFKGRTKKFEELNTGILKLTERIREDRNKDNPFTELLEKQQNNVLQIKEKLALFSDNEKYLQALEVIFSEDGVKRYIIDELIGHLNTLVKNYLIRLGSKYTCVFDSNFDFSFLTDSGPCDWNNFSSGEKARINIAVLFAIKDILVNTTFISSNLLFVDEFFDSAIDDFAIDNTLKLLREYVNNYNKTIFIISHREKIKQSTFDGEICVKLQNGFSIL